MAFALYLTGTLREESHILVRLARRRRARGFTLVELSVVVVIIAILAVLAIPAISAQMRDRRTRQAAQEVAGMFRNARTRAMGRGSAVLVRYDATVQTAGVVEIREAVRGTGANANCERLPSSSCTLTDWTDGATTNQLLTEFRPGVRAEYSGVNIEMYSAAPASALQNQMDVCFTPMGRAFVRFNQTGTFAAMTGVARARVRRMDSGAQVGLARNVLMIPNGHARLGQADTP